MARRRAWLRPGESWWKVSRNGIVVVGEINATTEMQACTRARFRMTRGDHSKMAGIPMVELSATKHEEVATTPKATTQTTAGSTPATAVQATLF